jgi:ribosomal protein S18 acetylase RimI-like enzyme
MDEITIRNFAPGDERRMAEVQARCVAACPDTGRFPPNFWLGPGFENGQNIFCAVNGQDDLLGYAAITPAYISRHLKARTLWLDLRADPQHARASAIKEVLFGWVFSWGRELARRWPGERVALSATYFGAGQASIEYLKGKGFGQYQTCLYMRRDLAEPMPWRESLTVPEGVEVRAWRMETEEEQRAYLAAYDLAFGDEGKNLEDLQHFMKSEHWSVGTTFTAFSGQQIVGSVAIWYQPGSRWAGKTEAVFVVPEWRRRGIARYLLGEAISCLKERGLAYAELEMDSSNKPARALYQSLGYRIHQEEVSLGLILEAGFT